MVTPQLLRLGVERTCSADDPWMIIGVLGLRASATCGGAEIATLSDGTEWSERDETG
jgi:hypothetical protein